MIRRAPVVVLVPGREELPAASQIPGLFYLRAFIEARAQVLAFGLAADAAETRDFDAGYMNQGELRNNRP